MEHMVYTLHKVLYGLKQAPRAWFNKIEAHFNEEGFLKCDSEQTLFTKRNSARKILIVSIYVDDLIYTEKDKELMQDFKAAMLRDFDMTDLGEMHYFHRIEVVQHDKGIFVCQRQYTEEILKRFGMSDCNPSYIPITPGIKLHEDVKGEQVDDTFYKQIVGSLCLSLD
ncbi:transmembrane signal receptor [Lithospermum erythrorhizon]|uniref:Transmembrane signal receptor n=1 Tax=Lithospermum erythrorhizon TaxID=34254 RepID=A0AAV3QCI3_LITER